MGQNYSGAWKNKEAQSCMPFLINLFGTPMIYTNKPGGLAIWDKKSFAHKTLFKQSICFEKVMIKDESVPNNNTNPPRYDFLYVFIKVPITADQQKSLTQLSSGLGYDRNRQILWARCYSLDTVIILLKLATDVITGQNSVASLLANGTIGTTMRSIQINNPITGNINIPKVRKMYMALCDNINKLNKEFFIDQPWYAITDPYSSNQPLDLALVEQDDAEYYQTIDNYMKSKNVSKSANAYPRAPGGKATLDNFYDVPKSNKKKEMMTMNTVDVSRGVVAPLNQACKGECAKRYNRIINNIGNEHLIDFNAYAGYMKKPLPQGGYQSEHLVPFNVYDKYQKTLIAPKVLVDALSEKMTDYGLLKKKNT